MRRSAMAAALILCSALVMATPAPTPRWATLPPTPAHVRPAASGHVVGGGARVYYAEYGKGRPVVLLHGGFVNSDYFGHQIRSLSQHHRVIVIDTRGHGRSRDDGAKPLSYELFAADVVRVMDHLRLASAAFVGWSDGANTALALAMRAPERVEAIVAFGANSSPDGLDPAADRKPAFAAYLRRARDEYPMFDPTPGAFDALERRLSAMWAEQPRWSDGRLGGLRTRVLVVDGDHDEAILRKHTEHLAKAIPGASLLILPGVSHFAFLQRPDAFNDVVERYLDDVRPERDTTTGHRRSTSG